MNKPISEILDGLKTLSNEFYAEFNVGGSSQGLENSRVTFIKTLESKEVSTQISISPLYTLAKARLFRIWEMMDVGQSVLLTPTHLVRNEVKTDLWFGLAKTDGGQPELYLTEKDDPFNKLGAGLVFNTVSFELEDWSIKNAAEYPLGKSLVSEDITLNFSFFSRFLNCAWVFSLSGGQKTIPSLSIVVRPLETIAIAANNVVEGVTKEMSASQALMKDDQIKSNFKRLVSYFYTEAFIQEEAKAREVEGNILRNEMIAQMPFEPSTSTWVRSVLDFKRRGVRGSSTLIECATMMSELKARLVHVGLDLSMKTFGSSGSIAGYVDSERVVVVKSGLAISERDYNGFGYMFRDESRQDLVVARTDENQEQLIEVARVLTEEVGPLNSCSYELMTKEVFSSSNLIKIVEAAKPSIRQFCNQLNEVFSKRPE